MHSRRPNRPTPCYPKAFATLPRRSRSAISLAVAAAIAGVALPPTPSLAADADASTYEGLQMVVVTARKREENLQEVPLSIDVFTKKDMQNLGISSFDDYAEKVPAAN